MRDLVRSEVERALGKSTAELLSQRRVAEILHVRDDTVRDLIARGDLDTIDGKVPVWRLLEWQRQRITKERSGRQGLRY